MHTTRPGHRTHKTPRHSDAAVWKNIAQERVDAEAFPLIHRSRISPRPCTGLQSRCGATAECERYVVVRVLRPIPLPSNPIISRRRSQRCCWSGLRRLQISRLSLGSRISPTSPWAGAVGGPPIYPFSAARRVSLRTLSSRSYSRPDVRMLQTSKRG